jgi:hypothetical protein
LEPCSPVILCEEEHKHLTRTSFRHWAGGDYPYWARYPKDGYLYRITGYCAEADVDALVKLLERTWRFRICTARPTFPGAWISRHVSGFYGDNTVSRQRIEALTEIADLVRGDALWFGRLVNPEPPPAAPKFLVEGLVPVGVVTLLAASRKVGKSTLLTELAVTVAQRGGQWAGFRVAPDTCSGFAVFLAGEDTDEVHARVAAMDDTGRPTRLIVPPRNGRPLADILEELRHIQVSLLVVDPARAWMTGDEDSSAAGDVFFRLVEDFAQKKGCAAVVAQHLKKDASPRTVDEIPGAIRGTGVFLDRPRVILGMVRSGRHTVVGIPAPSGDPLHNFRQSVMFAGQRRLIRDEATMRHLPADHHGGPPADDAVRDAVAAAITRLNAEGRPVARTGKSGIFEAGVPALAGFSRQRVRAATDALIDDGVVVDEHGELIAAASRGS